MIVWRMGAILAMTIGCGSLLAQTAPRPSPQPAAKPALPQLVSPQSPQGFVPPAPAVAPWANKMFLPDIAVHREQSPPPVIVHNFGEVPHGTICTHRFTITNIYDVPMQIMEVRKSCHCLDYVPMTKVLQPNESAEFVVMMNTGKFVGWNAQTLYVTFGPKYVSTAIIRLQATSRTDVSLNPGAIHFGTVPPGTRAVQRATVKYSGRSRDWKITEVVVPAAPITATLSEVSRGGLLRGGVEYQLEVVLQPTQQPGSFADTIYLKTNDPSQPVLRIAVSGTIAAAVECSPPQVQLDAVPVGKTVSQRVLVRAARPFRIVGVEGTGNGLQVELPPGDAALPVQFVTVVLTPPQAGTIQRVVRIRTDLDNAEVQLPIFAQAVTQ